MNENIAEFLKKSNVVAVVGASRHKEKFGYKIFHSLKNSGFKIYPVNPEADEVDNVKAYPSLSDLPEKPDVVVTIVPSTATEEVVKEANKLGVKKVWMQPGSESDKAIEYCEKNGISVAAKMCMVVDGLKKKL